MALIGRDQAQVRGDIQDHAAAAPGHLGADDPAAQERAGQPDGEVPLPNLQWEVLQPRPARVVGPGSGGHRRVDGRVVDQDVDTPEGLKDRGRASARRRRVA